MNLRTSIVGALLSVTFVLTGCVTQAYLDVQRAPELRLSGVRSVKVEPFTIGRCTLMEPDYSIKGLLASVLIETTMELVFGQDAIFEEYYQANLVGALENNGTYRITAGDDVDARIGGEIDCSVSNSVSKSSAKTKDGKESHSYQIDQVADVHIRFSVVDRVGKTLGASEVTATQRATRSAGSIDELKSRAETPDALVNGALAKSAELLVRKIAPHRVRERRTLATGDAPAIKKGNEAADRGNWHEAARFWSEALQSANPPDRVAGLYNLAIHDERQGELEEARKKYDQIHALKQDRKYEDAAARIRVRIEEEAWLRTEFGAETVK